MQQLNQRQQKIAEYISKKESANNSEIVEFLGNQVSRHTVVRDLKVLLAKKLITKEGKGRNVFYSPSGSLDVDSFFDLNSYFKKEADQRKVKEFNPDIVENFSKLFLKKEISELEERNDKYLKKVKKLSKTLFKKEVERLTIELSWKSSQIEGNTYSLIDTEILIKERVEAKGHRKEETVMILNHKRALDYVFENTKEFKKTDLFSMEKIHQMLTTGMGVKKGIRNNPVRIIGTKYIPPESRVKIVKFLNSAFEKINSTKDPFSKALALILVISYAQPFEDGNKRTARILANAVLMANNACPLSYRSVDESDYKKAMILFYEQNSFRFFKELFVGQFKFSVNNYF